MRVKSLLSAALFLGLASMATPADAVVSSIYVKYSSVRCASDIRGCVRPIAERYCDRRAAAFGRPADSTRAVYILITSVVKNPLADSPKDWVVAFQHKCDNKPFVSSAPVFHPNSL